MLCKCWKKSFYASMNPMKICDLIVLSHIGTDADYSCSILLFNTRSRCTFYNVNVHSNVWNQLTAVKKDDIYDFNINAAHVCHILCESHKTQLTFNCNAWHIHVHNKMQCLSLIKIYSIQWWIVLDISSQLKRMNETINFLFHKVSMRRCKICLRGA